jgi:DNA-binding IclR family transcriptional regulator
VHAGDGELVAALSVSAPLFRTGEDVLIGDLRDKVVRAAEELSASLGYSA